MTPNKLLLRKKHKWIEYTIEWEGSRGIYLKKLISITYTNKMHLCFSNPSLKNSIIKHAWFGAILGWVSSRKVSLEAFEWDQIMLKALCWFVSTNIVPESCYIKLSLYMENSSRMSLWASLIGKITINCWIL